MRPKLRRIGNTRNVTKAINLWAFQAGATAMLPSSYIHIDHLDDAGEHGLVPDESAHTMCSIPTQEEVFEKKSLCEGLSEEALYVLNLVLQAPSEILELIATPKQKNITKRRVGKFLKYQGWPPKKVRLIFEELATFTEGLEA